MTVPTIRAGDAFRAQAALLNRRRQGECGYGSEPSGASYLFCSSSIYEIKALMAAADVADEQEAAAMAKAQEVLLPIVQEFQEKKAVEAQLIAEAEAEEVKAAVAGGRGAKKKRVVATVAGVAVLGAGAWWFLKRRRRGRRRGKGRK